MYLGKTFSTKSDYLPHIKHFKVFNVFNDKMRHISLNEICGKGRKRKFRELI